MYIKKIKINFGKIENISAKRYNILAKRARHLSNPSWKLVANELIEFYHDLQVAIRYGNDLYKAHYYQLDVVAIRNKHTKEFLFIHLDSLKIALRIN